jgi:hypothetical protein
MLEFGILFAITFFGLGWIYNLLISRLLKIDLELGHQKKKIDLLEDNACKNKILINKLVESIAILESKIDHLEHLSEDSHIFQVFQHNLEFDIAKLYEQIEKIKQITSGYIIIGWYEYELSDTQDILSIPIICSQNINIMDLESELNMCISKTSAIKLIKSKFNLLEINNPDQMIKKIFKNRFNWSDLEMQNNIENLWI